MRAIVSSPNGPVIQDFEEPIAGPGFVKVRVRAAALNRADLAMLTGASHGVAGGMGMPLGLEWAGDVVEVGEGVEHISVGDRVMAAGPGAFCEYAVIMADWVYQMPGNMSYEQAAALPVALQTAHDAVASNGLLERGQTVLVQGASSVVGLMAMQVAKLLGASKVIGTSTTSERVQRLAEFGADLGVNTRDEDWIRQVLKATRMKGVDLVIDFLGGAYVNANMQAACLGGCIVNVGRMAGDQAQVDLDLHSMRRIQYVGVTFRTRMPAEITQVIARATRALMPALRDGTLRIPVDQVYRFDQVHEAFERMSRNEHFGKLVLSQN